MHMLGCALTASMITTETLLMMQGRWQEALPLHLCSVSALAALRFAFRGGQWLLDFLWYLGIPGAMLALIFPAPAVSRWQALFNASYAVTHGMIILIPALAIAKGAHVRRGREGAMLAAIHALALAAIAANCRLGTDFLFLAAPPEGTPLCIAYSLGYLPYFLTLELLVFALLTVTGRLLPRFFPSVMQ